MFLLVLVIYLFDCFISSVAGSVASLNLVKPEINAMQNTKRFYSNYPLGVRSVRSVGLASRERSDQFGR